MGLDEVRVVPGDDVVSDHESRKLVGVKVPIREEGRVGLVDRADEASHYVSPDRNGNVTEVVSAEGYT